MLSGYILLIFSKNDNSCVLTEIKCIFFHQVQLGINYFFNLEQVVKKSGDNYKFHTKKKVSSITS
jgi:hypothetical protein